MLPMVTVPAELDAGTQMLGDCNRGAARPEGIARCPPLGIMVEVPAAALTAERFDADFYSIGSQRPDPVRHGRRAR